MSVDFTSRSNALKPSPLGFTSVDEGSTAAKVDFSFERLIAPISTREFLESYWEQRPLIINRHSPSFYGPILTFADIDHLLHIARESQTSLMHTVPPPGSERIQRSFRGKDISVAGTYQAFSSGDTLWLSSIHSLWTPIASLRASVREALETEVQVNAYLTPANSQGFPVHFDGHDVLVLQVDGSKEWYIYDRYIDAPIDTDRHLSYTEASLHEELASREDRLQLLRTVRLERGDLLYLPRGFPHKAVSTEEASLHLAVGIYPLYWVDLLKAAMENVCLQQPELRRALPPGFINDSKTRAAIARQFRELLDLAASEADLDRTLDQVIGLRIKHQTYPPDGHFAQIIQSAQLDLDTVVRRRRGIDCRLIEQDGAKGIAFAGDSLHGPAKIGPALSYIRDHRQFRVGDLPGPLDDPGKLVLVRRLVRKGLLQAV